MNHRICMRSCFLILNPRFMVVPKILFLAFCFLPACLLGQGSLTPPGAPAPTMKTLDQIEAHASLRFDNGAERFRFEVKSVRPQKLTDENAELFQPTSGCFEIQPVPF